MQLKCLSRDWGWGFAAAVLAFGVQASSGVTVATTSGDHSADPGTGFQWDNVLDVISSGNGSAVYLGGGWVLTASHVADDGTPIRVSYGGDTYFSDPSHIYTLDNPSVITDPSFSAQADLVLYRLTEAIGLPSVNVGGVSNGNSITMVGYSSNTKEWATNIVESTGQVVSISGGNDVIGFVTNYDTGVAGDGQAETGDSGGAGFYFNGSEWILAGIMVANDNSSTPAQTFFADLGATHLTDPSFESYADQIDALIATHGVIPEPSGLVLAILGMGSLLRRRRA